MIAAMSLSTGPAPAPDLLQDAGLPDVVVAPQPPSMVEPDFSKLLMSVSALPLPAAMPTDTAVSPMSLGNSESHAGRHRCAVESQDDAPLAGTADPVDPVLALLTAAVAAAQWPYPAAAPPACPGGRTESSDDSPQPTRLDGAMQPSPVSLDAAVPPAAANSVGAGAFALEAAQAAVQTATVPVQVQPATEVTIRPAAPTTDNHVRIGTETLTDGAISNLEARDVGGTRVISLELRSRLTAIDEVTLRIPVTIDAKPGPAEAIEVVGDRAADARIHRVLPLVLATESTGDASFSGAGMSGARQGGFDLAQGQGSAQSQAQPDRTVELDAAIAAPKSRRAVVSGLLA